MIVTTCRFLRTNIIVWTMQWGLTNFDAATLFVRDRRNLTDALDVTPEYLRTEHGDAGKSLHVEFTVFLAVSNGRCGDY